MKKQYMKPSMKVYKVHMTHLICTSGGDRGIPGYDDDFGYMPNFGEDGMNKMA